MNNFNFEESEFINYNSGEVKTNPQDLYETVKNSSNVEDKIKLFQCRVEVWQIGVALEILKNIELAKSPKSIWAHSAYAMLSITLSYFEMIGKILNQNSCGKGTSNKDFNYGFCDVFPKYKPSSCDYADDQVPDVKEFRDRSRNGLYHIGYTKNNLLIHNSPDNHEVLEKKNLGGTIVYFVNPHLLVRSISKHFPIFIQMLRNSDENNVIQTNFIRFFDNFYQ